MIEVTARLGVQEPPRKMVVRAGSIIDALSVAEEYSLEGGVSVVFPVDADRFFIQAAAKTSRLEERK